MNKNMGFIIAGIILLLVVIYYMMTSSDVENYSNDALLRAAHEGDTVKVRKILRKKVDGKGGRAYRDKMGYGKKQ